MQEKFTVRELASKADNNQLLDDKSFGTPSDRPGSLSGPRIENLPTVVTTRDTLAESQKHLEDFQR
jgi:hypothetical protein